MPTQDNRVKFISCSSTSYKGLGTYDQDTLYFLSDTKQLFVGDNEYTKTLQVLVEQPNASVIGELGRVYVYNGSVYMCTPGELGTYKWERIANVNDAEGTLTAITAGDGLTGGTITEAGTISHAIPEGATERNVRPEDVTAEWGGSFEVTDVVTDKFGHVTGVNKHEVTLPKKDSIEVTTAHAEDVEIPESEGEFEVIVEVQKGPKTHQLNIIKKTIKMPKLPEDRDTTYTLAEGDDPGSVKLIDSNGKVSQAVIKDFEKLAKITDFTSVFRYRGRVSTKSKLPETGNDLRIGDVYFVVDTGSEWVYLGDRCDPPWEEFGPTIDLSPYAKKDETMPRVDGLTGAGRVAMITSDGTVASSGHTVEADVPADAVFTDTIYKHPTFQEHPSGLYKVEVTKQGHIIAVEPVTKEDILALGISDENTDTKVRTTPTTQRMYVAGTPALDDSTGELHVDSKVFVENGVITAERFHGRADEAEMAVKDASGRNIEDTYLTKKEADDTYATKDESGQAALVWQTI